MNVSFNPPALQEWQPAHYRPTKYITFSHQTGFSISTQNILNATMYGETGLCLFLQLINIIMLHRLRNKTVAELLVTQLICVQTMLAPTNVVLFHYHHTGNTYHHIYQLCA